MSSMRQGLRARRGRGWCGGINTSVDVPSRGLGLGMGRRGGGGKGWRHCNWFRATKLTNCKEGEQRSMKIAVTSTGTTLEAAVDPRFGRCSHFVLVDTNDMSVEAMENESGLLGGGAGIQSAQFMAQKGVGAILTGNCGPNAHQTLSAAGIEVFVGCSGTVAEAVERFKSGQLCAATAPNVASHAGMGGQGR